MVISRILLTRKTNVNNYTSFWHRLHTWQWAKLIHWHMRVPYVMNCNNDTIALSNNETSLKNILSYEIFFLILNRLGYVHDRSQYLIELLQHCLWLLISFLLHFFPENFMINKIRCYAMIHHHCLFFFLSRLIIVSAY